MSDITVLDLTRNLAGPYATMTLGDLGARVIKIERPEVGDDTRHWHPPSWGGYSSLFLAINRNKESVALDIDADEGRDAVRAIAAKVDVIVESNRTGSLERRGLGFADLRVVNPRLVYCSISGFGSRGPDRERPGYDSIIQAASGVMSINGDPGGAPVRVGASIIDMGTGMWAALAVVAALRRRDLSGEPQLVETSLMEAGVAWMSYQAAGFRGDGTVAHAHGSRHPLMAPYEVFNTRDGYLLLAALNDNLFIRLCTSLGMPELGGDARFRTNPDRVLHRDELHDLLQEPLLSDDSALWEQRLIADGVPCSTIKEIDEVLEDPQLEALGMVREWPHPILGPLPLVDHPVAYNGIRSFRHSAPPELGQHTYTVLKEFGYDIDRLRVKAAGPDTSAPKFLD